MPSMGNFFTRTKFVAYCPPRSARLRRSSISNLLTTCSNGHSLQRSATSTISSSFVSKPTISLRHYRPPSPTSGVGRHVLHTHNKNKRLVFLVSQTYPFKNLQHAQRSPLTTWCWCQRLVLIPRRASSLSRTERSSEVIHKTSQALATTTP